MSSGETGTATPLAKVDSVTLPPATKTISRPVFFFNSAAVSALKYEPTFKVPTTAPSAFTGRTLSSAASPLVGETVRPPAACPDKRGLDLRQLALVVALSRGIVPAHDDDALRIRHLDGGDGRIDGLEGLELAHQNGFERLRIIAS